MSFNPVLNQKSKIYIVPETNYAGGPAGLAKSRTKVTTADTPIDLLPFKDGSDITLPLSKFENSDYGGVFSNKHARFHLRTKQINGEGETTHYFNTVEYGLLKGAVLTEGVNPSKSWVIHFDDGNTRYEAYGCFIQEAAVTIPEEEAPELKIKWRSYAQTLEANELDSLDYSFDDSQPLLRKDVYITLNDVELPFKSANLTFKNNAEINYDRNGHNAMIENNELVCDIKTIFPTTTQYNAIMTTNIEKKTLVFTFGLLGTITVSDVEVFVESPETIGGMKSEFREVTLKVAPTATTEVTIV